MEHRIKATFKKVQDAVKFIDFLVDSGIDSEAQIHPTHITRHPIVGHIVEQHIVNYTIDDMYVDPEDAIEYDIDYLENEYIKDYSISLDGKECKH